MKKKSEKEESKQTKYHDGILAKQAYSVTPDCCRVLRINRDIMATILADIKGMPTSF